MASDIGREEQQVGGKVDRKHVPEEARVRSPLEDYEAMLDEVFKDFADRGAAVARQVEPAESVDPPPATPDAPWTHEGSCRSSDERVIVFPDRGSIGRLYRRPAGRRRWTPWCGAKGEVLLQPGTEYQLRLSSAIYRPPDLARVLASVDHDELDEIQLHFRVRQDLWFQILFGPWQQQLLHEWEQEIRQHFRTRARLVFKMRLR